MRCLLLIGMVALAVPALGTAYFPVVPGAIWTLADDDPAITSSLTMAGQVTWHGAVCYPRYESIDGVLVGITYWSTDAEGRALMHGLKYLGGGGDEFYFTPPAVYLDPGLEIGESTTSNVNVYEVHEFADQWHGELAVQLTCTDRGPVTTPLGTYAAVTVDPAWIDSPISSIWRYGHDGVFSYGFGVGPVRITSHISPEEQILVQLDNFVPTDVPTAAATEELVLLAAPNPFNPTTTLSFDLPIAGRARLEIYDLRGRRLDILHEGPLPAGHHEVAWQPRDLGSGVYLSRLTTPLGATTTRLTLIE